MSHSLWPYGLQHARLPCPSPTPGTYSNSCPSNQWCHPTISSSVVPFSHLQSFPASGSFQMSQFFASGGQNIGVSASISVLPMNIQNWFPLGLTGWSSLLSKGLLSLLQHHSSKAAILQCSAFFIVQLSYPYMTTGKTIALTTQIFVGKVMSLVLKVLLVIAFLPRCPFSSKDQASFNFMAEVTMCSDFGAQKIKYLTVSIVSPSICHEAMGLDAMILVFKCWVLSQLFHSPLSLSLRGSLVLQFLP